MAVKHDTCMFPHRLRDSHSFKSCDTCLLAVSKKYITLTSVPFPLASDWPTYRPLMTHLREVRVLTWKTIYSVLLSWILYLFNIFVLNCRCFTPLNFLAIIFIYSSRVYKLTPLQQNCDFHHLGLPEPFYLISPGQWSEVPPP